MASLDPVALIESQWRKNPALVVGAGVAIAAGAVLIARRGAPPPEDVAAEDPDAEDAMVGDASVGYADSNPFPGGQGVGTFDPGSFDFDTGGTVGPDLTPDGCRLPKPAVPASLEGKGDYHCETGSWVWSYSSAPTTPTTPTKPGTPKVTGPRITIRKGKALHHYALKGGKLQDGKARTITNGATWKTAAAVRTLKTAGGTTLRAVQLKSGPLSGRWVSVTVGTWVAK